jgi:hypothetical protein
VVESIEIYQEMTIQGAVEHRPALRKALIAAAVAPWKFDPKASAKAISDLVSSQEVLTFQRQKTDDLPDSSLWLVTTDTGSGYYVSNIVPSRLGHLTVGQFNAVLKDFADRVAAPVTVHHKFSIHTSPPRQSLEDWLSPDAETKLRCFSAMANKTTGSSHPADKLRWLDFIIAVHKSSNKCNKFDDNKLTRWLNEVDGWNQVSAGELGVEYGDGIALLKRYDTLPA